MVSFPGYTVANAIAVLTTHRANPQPFGGLGSGRKRNGRREGKVMERLGQEDAANSVDWKKKRFLWNHISHVPVTLSRPWMRAHLD